MTDPAAEQADELTTEEPEFNETEADELQPEELQPDRKIDWSRVLAYGILPALALVLGLTAGGLKYVDNSVRDGDMASTAAMQVAESSTIAILSYQPDTVEKQLTAARDLLTGGFRTSYTDLTTNVVIPGAQQQKISAAARVPAASTVSADPNRAVVLLFVNQTVTIGADAPSDTASSVRVTLDKVGGKWLISKFEPV